MANTGLKKELGLFALTMIAIGSTIGSGIFITPATVTKTLPSPAAIVLVWSLGGLVALCGALTYAELGSQFPREGGLYNFLKEAWGRRVAFLYGWANFLVINTGSLAAIALVFAKYLAAVLGLGESAELPIAAVGLVVVTAINITGVRSSGIFASIFTVLKLTGIAFIIGAGFFFGEPSRMGSFTAGFDALPLTAFGVGMMGVLWSYGGWQHASYLSGEARNAAKTIPLAMIIGASTVTVVYLAANAAYMFLLPIPDLAASGRVASDALAVAAGPWAAVFIALVIFASTFGTAGIYTMSAPRIYLAMAEDGMFFPQFAKLHARWGTPVFAIVTQTAWALALLFFWGTFSNLIGYVLFADWIFFLLAAAAVFVLRRRGLVAPYRTPLFPLPPVIFIGVAAAFVLSTLIEKPEQAYAGIGLLGFGLVLYELYFKRLNMS